MVGRFGSSYSFGLGLGYFRLVLCCIMGIFEDKRFVVFLVLFFVVYYF